MPFDATPTRERQDCPAPTTAPRFPDEIAIIDQMTALIATPETWCQWTLTKPGKPSRYCLVGALRMVDHGDVYECFSSPAARLVWNRLYGLSSIHPSRFNDRRSHQDVLNLLAKARASFL